ncbi:MAG: hypothetical protein MUC49_02255 [Raineya sp.]|jgi:hypothetical protein|nr:hypothetical protein [Raineya sp.]
MLDMLLKMIPENPGQKISDFIKKKEEELGGKINISIHRTFIQEKKEYKILGTIFLMNPSKDFTKKEGDKEIIIIRQGQSGPLPDFKNSVISDLIIKMLENEPMLQMALGFINIEEKLEEMYVKLQEVKDAEVRFNIHFDSVINETIITLKMYSPENVLLNKESFSLDEWLKTALENKEEMGNYIQHFLG